MGMRLKASDFCPPAPSSSRREGAGGESVLEEGMLPSALTPPDNARSLSPFEHRRERREADMQAGVRLAPAFQGQKFADACHFTAAISKSPGLRL